MTNEEIEKAVAGYYNSDAFGVGFATMEEFYAVTRKCLADAMRSLVSQAYEEAATVAEAEVLSYEEGPLWYAGRDAAAIAIRALKDSLLQETVST